MVGIIAIALMISLRYKVGADWETYKLLFSYAGYANLGQLGRAFVKIISHGGLFLSAQHGLRQLQ